MPATRGIFLFQTTILVRNGHLCPGIVRDMSLRVHNYLPKIKLQTFPDSFRSALYSFRSSAAPALFLALTKPPDALGELGSPDKNTNLKHHDGTTNHVKV